MNLRETIKKVLKEESNFSPQFKRRMNLFKQFIYTCFVYQNPCDYEDFYHFMQGIYSEVEEYASGIYDADDNNRTPDWLTYEEGVDFVETHMIDELKEHYYENCHSHDLNESKPIYMYFYGDTPETLQYSKILNKHMGKYDWWKGIEIRQITYNRGRKSVTLYADLNVDETWGKKQWETYVNLTFPGNSEEVSLSKIIGGDFYYELREEFSKIFEFTFGLPINSFVMDYTKVNFVPTKNIQESVRGRDEQDLSSLIKKSLISIIERESDIICGVEVTAPWNRESLEFNKPFRHYKILVKFIGGQNQDDYDSIMDEMWDTVYSYLGVAADLYSQMSKKCEETNKQEQTEGELTEKCWAGYTQKGMKTMFGKRYPNCVKKTK